MSTSTIYDLASQGTLTEEHLQDADRLQAINAVHSESSLTPLGAAVLNGRVSATRLLLRHKADVNKLSGTRTPLWIAVSQMQREKNIGIIVKMLLEEGADPNVPSADHNNSAPLLNAIRWNRGPEVVAMLVESGASRTAEDSSGMSAERFAEKKGLKIQTALLPEWRMGRYKAAGMVAGLVLFVVAWSNTTLSQRRLIAGGATLLTLIGGSTAAISAAFSAGQRITRPIAPTQPANGSTAKSNKDPPTDAIAPTAGGDTAEPARINGAQATPDETTPPTASDIKPTNNSPAQLDTDKDDSGTATSGAIFERFGLAGDLSNDMDPNLRKLMEEEDVEKFKNSINDYIKEKNLDRFFPPDNPFLQAVLGKALELKKDPSNKLNVKDLTKLSLYQTVLYLDDSGSMAKRTRRDDLRNLVKRITGISTKLLPVGEGVELRFINATVDPSHSKPSMERIDNIISDLRMSGWTPIGTNLRAKILIPLVYHRLRSEEFTRPMLISIITDGYPEGPKIPGQKNLETRDSLKQAILECRTRLERRGFHPNTILFQISQIGAEQEATQFLDSLRQDKDLDEILYCTTDQLDAKYQKMHDNNQQLEQWLFETMLSPIYNAYPG